MSERKFLRFNCTTCKAHDFVEAFIGDDGGAEIDETWPIGWLHIDCYGIGLSKSTRHYFCNKCKLPVLNLFGFDSYKSYLSVVKANTERERSLATSQAVQTEAVPFYLLDEEN